MPPGPHTRLLTGAQMARIEAATIAAGTPGHLLMERAGAGAARVLEQALGGFRGRRVAVFCGKGNNGGDGSAIARIAREKGAEAGIFLFAPKSAVAGDASRHLSLAERAGVPVIEALTGASLQEASAALQGAHAAVDALLGTGLAGPPRGPVEAGIGLLASGRAPVFAVDLPSGLSADTGRPLGPCARARHTITFGFPKRGHYFHPGRDLCGRISLVDIGLLPPADAPEDVVRLIAARGGAPMLPLRSPTAHKGECGRVAVIAGSLGMAGAAVLSGGAALRAGAGLVTVGVPEALVDVVAAQQPELMTRPLPGVRKAGCLSLRARGEVLRLIDAVDVVAMGPGLGRHRETVSLVRRLLSDVRKPLVLDADGLNALRGESLRLAEVGAPVVITPHPGEFERLAGRPVVDPLADARALAGACRVTVVLKGAPTVVALPSGEAFVNPSGNPGMATAGSGDLLTGLIAGLAAQGMSLEEAAILGVYLHGLAGDLCAESLDQAGMIAGDILGKVPAALSALRAGRDRDRYIRPLS